MTDSGKGWSRAGIAEAMVGAVFQGHWLPKLPSSPRKGPCTITLLSITIPTLAGVRPRGLRPKHRILPVQRRLDPKLTFEQPQREVLSVTQTVNAGAALLHSIVFGKMSGSQGHIRECFDTCVGYLGKSAIKCSSSRKGWPWESIKPRVRAKVAG